jgi:hypothetical protein
MPRRKQTLTALTMAAMRDLPDELQRKVYLFAVSVRRATKELGREAACDIHSHRAR